MKIRGYLVLLFLTLVLLPFESSAQTRAGLFRVSLDTTLFGFGTGEVDYDDNGGEYDFDAASVGIGLDSAGIGGGYTVIDGLVLGARLTFGLRGFDDYLYDEDAFVWSVVPYGEYIFLSGIARPFVTAVLGFEGKSLGDDLGDRWWWGFEFGAGGGGHFFVMPNVSIDATLICSFIVGTGENEQPQNDIDYSHWRFRLSALAGLSAWF